VSFSLSHRDFAFFSELHNQWLSESGDFSISIGNSSRNLPLQQNVKLSVIDVPKPVYTRYSLVKDVQGHPVGKMFIEKLMQQLAGSYMSLKPAEEMSEAEQVNAMKVNITMKALIADMPVKNIVQFSKGQVSEQDLNNILAALNQ